MSRTYRRIHAHNRSTYVPRLEDVDGWDLERWSLSDPARFLARKSARFHADKGRVGRWSVPSWYCRERNKRDARQARAELHRCRRADDWESFLRVVHSRGAGFFWF